MAGQKSGSQRGGAHRDRQAEGEFGDLRLYL
jgi:hypothetical protein